MAIAEHVDKVKEGINSFNNWRNNNPNVIPDLSHADLSRIESDKIRNWDLKSGGYNFENAILWGTNLSGSCLIESNLRNAKLFYADLQGAYCINANMEGANFLNANIKGAILINANMEGADLSGIKYDRRAKYRGIRVSTSYGSPRFIRFARDQDFIEELREESSWGKVLYYLWSIFSDCGRSFSHLLIWIIAIVALFGAIYADYTIPSSFSWLPEPIKGWLYDIDPKIRMNSQNGTFTPYYFSIVTFTTLGFGDVTPLNRAGEVWVSIEVCIGYIMLGLLIAILSDKVARRAG